MDKYALEGSFGFWSTIKRGRLCRLKDFKMYVVIQNEKIPYGAFLKIV